MPAKVEKIFIHKSKNLVEINGDLRATPLHPFALESAGVVVWRNAGALTEGDCLISLNSPCIEVSAIQNIVGSVQPVYNIQVAGLEIISYS